MRPIEIIGGGLAGLSLGLALRRADVPVTLHEAGRYPRHRVCGEFIAGLDATTSDKLGLAPFLADSSIRREVVWIRHDTVINRHTLPEPAFALSRHTLDKRLAEAFEAQGGDLRTGSRMDPLPAPPGRVFAHGRHAIARSPWLGLKCHARGLDLTAHLEVHLGQHAYVGLCLLPDGWVNITGLFRRRPGLALDRASALPAYLHATGLHSLAERLAAAETDPESCCAVAGLAFGCSPPSASAKRLVLGDAHALIPPFTGNGMAMAFQSAELALDPLLAWSRDVSVPWSETVARIQKSLHARFRLRLVASSALHPAILQPRGQAGLALAARTHLLPTTPLYHALH